MKVMFDGQDYLLILDKKTQELQKLQQAKLKTQLTDWGDKELGKIVSLELAENNAIDGIELKYLPDSSLSWEAIKRVQIKLDERAYSYIKERGQFGTRYNGSDKVEIMNGDPRFDSDFY